MPKYLISYVENIVLCTREVEIYLVFNSKIKYPLFIIRCRVTVIEWITLCYGPRLTTRVVIDNDRDHKKPGRVAQSVGHLTRKSGVLGSIPGLATYFRFSFRFFKKGSCQLLAKVCARSTD